MNQPLADMLRYNKWANQTLFEACRALSDEQLDAAIDWTSGTIRALLLHLAGGQQTFVLRTQGRQHAGELNRWSVWPGFDAVLDVLSRSSDELIAIAEKADGEATADLAWQGKVFRFPKNFFLVHAMEHGVEHRTEIKLALASMGVETPDLDGWHWAAAAGLSSEV
ncbi:MAG: DinB family protein [Dehalococcoidia bacterium]